MKKRALCALVSLALCVTLAGQAAAVLGCSLFHMDDFFLPPALRTPEHGAVRHGVQKRRPGRSQDRPGAEWACRPGGGHRICHD